jgi:hypothetical protein
MVFRSIQLASAFEKVAIQYRITIQTQTRWHPCVIQANVTVAATLLMTHPRRTTIGYSLVGRIRPGLNANSEFSVQQLLCKPVLTSRWAQYARSTRLISRLEHGNFGFFPGAGLSRRAEFRIMEGEQLRVSDSVSMESFDNREYFVYILKRKLKRNIPYTTDMTVNLEPLFDKQTITLKHTFR